MARMYRSTGSQAFDTISIKQLDADNFTDERKKVGGSYHATGRIAIVDGKTMTITINGAFAKGEQFTNTFVFDRQ